MNLKWCKHSWLPEMELFTVEKRPPFFNMEIPFIPYFRWSGGVLLSRWLLDNPHIVQNKTVYDLGAGTGIVAIAASKAGASKVISIDRFQHSKEISEKNFQHNKVEVEFDVMDILDLQIESKDNVLFCISFGHPRNLPLLEKMIQFANEGQEVYIVYTERPQPCWFPPFEHKVVEEKLTPVEVDGLEHSSHVVNKIIKIGKKQ
jgi:predicted nicotinamide N-methyase